MGMQINAVSEFDLNEWDAVDGLGMVWPEYEGMYGLDDVGMVWPEYDGMYGLDGCTSCGIGAPPPAALSKPKSDFPWGTVLIGAGGLGVGILAAVLIKKYLRK